MLPLQQSLPLPYRLFDLAGRQVESLGLKVGDLRPETLFQDAQRLTGLNDWGDSYFQKGMDNLLGSLESDANLRFYGRLVMRFMLGNYLSQRLRFVDAHKNKPGQFQPFSQPPIVVTGLHRSGTTFLHRLLSLDPKNTGLPFWQLYRPFGPPGLGDLRKIKAWMELSILKPIFPGIKRKHSIRPFCPEESCWMMGLTFHSMVFWIMAPVTSYVEWLWNQDFRQAYREYGRLLQAQQFAYPGQRLALKAPDHMPHLDLLLDVIPGARVIQLNRDPATCALSLSSLFYSTHIALSERVDPKHMAQANISMMATFLQRNRQTRKDPVVNKMVLDLPFGDLVADPLGTVRLVYDHFGLAFSEDYAARLSHHLQGMKNKDQRNHHYTAEQFGLSEPEIQAFFRGLDVSKKNCQENRLVK